MLKKRPHPSAVRRLLAMAGAAVTTGLVAQTAPTAADKPAPSAAGEEDVVILSPFEVTAESSTGYAATQTLAGSRINTRLEDVGSAISVVTAEFLKDTGATDNKTLLAYTTNTEVGGTQGNFKGVTGGKSEDEGGRLVSPNGTTRVRGLTSADNTRNFFSSDIPWDGYNTDRIDMQRGANSILFGLGSPAGIINTTTKSAQHRTFGSVEFRYGAFGANRVSLDYNQNLLDDELSVRVNLLRNDEQYKQQPAYSLDRRMFATLRYDPKFLNRGGSRTSIKVNFENGTVRSSNPRTITPTDCFTTWWSKVDQAAYDPNRVQNSGYFYTLDASGKPTYGTDGKQTGGYYPADAGQYNVGKFNTQVWLGAPSFYGGIWMPVPEGTTTPSAYLQPEYATIGGLKSTGAIDGGIGGLPFSRRVTMATSAYVAERDPSMPYRAQGVWKATTLSDPSIFDFYNNLLEGENKSEWQNFKNFNASLTQTFFKEKVGFEAAYAVELYRRGQYSFGNTLFVDINSKMIGGAANPNFGKAYVESGNTWGNGLSGITHESSRMTAFATHDFNEGGKKGWVWKLMGKHILSGLYSQEMYRSDSRSFKRYGTEDSFSQLVALNPATTVRGLNANERAVSTTVYLSDSLAGASSPEGLYVPRAGGAVQVSDNAQFRYFDATWNSNVNPADPWTSTYNNEVLTQSENPANYVGWKDAPVNILSAEDGDAGALTFGATLNKRKVDSRAAVLQSYFWDGAIVGMYGIRHDNVKSWAASAFVPTAWPAADHVDLGYIIPSGRVDAGMQQYSTVGRTYQLTRANSPSWSVVAKLNKFLGKFGERLPVNVSLFYNESRNFQVAGTRNDIYGQPLPPPSGQTNDRGLMLSTKDERFSLKINKYQTSVLNSSNSILATWFLLGGGNFIQRNEDRADAYEYHLTSVGDPNSVAETGTTTGSWTWRYAPRTINGVPETQEQSDALAASAVAAWRSYTKEPIVQRILKAWGFNDFNGIAPTTMSTPVSNFTATEDQLSKGWEYEFTANPTKSWRITFNASDTKAQRNNVGGAALQEFVDLTNRYENGPVGDMRQWGGGQTTPDHPGLNSWNGNFYQTYALMRLQEGTNTPEIRRWRFNVITNYGFTTGRFKGVNVGGGYRWEDKIAIGYPMKTNADGSVGFDIENPYYGPTSGHFDLWFGYERKLTAKLDGRVQFNLRNAFDGNKLVPLTTQYDGTVAAWGIAPVRTWTVTNTFSF
ncbi:MAG: TonB-dependent receptor [Opitutaceae bacterium]|nr:TonB-dependent receptor [Opitutaceae bacterium]